MPNYVINTIKIEGEQSIIDELMFSVKSDESNFDFEKIIPSPESMKIESGTNTDISLAIYEFEKTGSDPADYDEAYARDKRIDEIIEEK